MTECARDGAKPAPVLIVVGASAGGLEPLATLLKALPDDVPAAVCVAIHQASGASGLLPRLLAQRSGKPVENALTGRVLARGGIYLAPPDQHLVVRDGVLEVNRSPRHNGQRPSIDMLFRSAARNYGRRAIAVVLSGNLDCGALGLVAIKARGGLAVVQAPSEALYPSMPRSALAHTHADRVGTARELGVYLGERAFALAAADGLPELASAEGAEERVDRDQPMLSCPACQGVLSHVRICGADEFRCHIGHGFSWPALMVEQSDALERALWSGVRALEESAQVAARLASSGFGAIEPRFQEKAQEQRRQAAVLRDIALSHLHLNRDDAVALLAMAAPASGKDPK